MKNIKKDKTMQNPGIQLELPNLNTYKFLISGNETDFYNDAPNKKINMAFHSKASTNRGAIELDVCDMLRAKTNKSFI